MASNTILGRDAKKSKVDDGFVCVEELIILQREHAPELGLFLNRKLPQVISSRKVKEDGS